MRVFISWSGTVSQQLAVGLRDWLPRVLQFVSPYVSTTDIERGSRWSYELARELETTSFGILCVTKASVQAPWLNFEAGAISKSVENSRVVPLLFDLKPTDVEGPLVQFQMSDCEKASMKLLIRNMNAIAGDAGLDDARLSDSFEIWWSLFEAALLAIREENKSATDGKPKKEDDNTRMLEEILLRLRSQQNTKQGEGSLIPPGALSDLRVRWEHFVSALARSGALTDAALEDAFSRLRTPISFITRSDLPVMAKQQWELRDDLRSGKATLDEQLSVARAKSEKRVLRDGERRET